MKPSRPRKAKTKLYDNSRTDKQEDLSKALEKWEADECICDFCVYRSTCDDSVMCTECEEYEFEGADEDE